ncbi:MAG: FUN14 domain-containing protein [Alphaproteobacteria bacterium]
MFPQELLSGPLGTLGVGGLLGASAGYAAKKLSRLALLVVGLGFLLVQLLAWQGWIEVRWEHVEAAARAQWQSPDGTTLLDRAWRVASANLPFGGAFAAGFAIGFRLG